MVRESVLAVCRCWRHKIDVDEKQSTHALLSGDLVAWRLELKLFAMRESEVKARNGDLRGRAAAARRWWLHKQEKKSDEPQEKCQAGTSRFAANERRSTRNGIRAGSVRAVMLASHWRWRWQDEVTACHKKERGREFHAARRQAANTQQTHERARAFSVEKSPPASRLGSCPATVPSVLRENSSASLLTLFCWVLRCRLGCLRPLTLNA